MTWTHFGEKLLLYGIYKIVWIYNVRIYNVWDIQGFYEYTVVWKLCVLYNFLFVSPALLLLLIHIFSRQQET